MCNVMKCAICQKLKDFTLGLNSSVIYEFKHSLFVLGEHQFHKYYCMILSKQCVREVHHLAVEDRNALMADVFAAGEFLETWTACKKINYSCLGNLQPHIHWHIFPRYEDDPDFSLSPWLHYQKFNSHIPSKYQRDAIVQELTHNFKLYLEQKGIPSES